MFRMDEPARLSYTGDCESLEWMETWLDYQRLAYGSDEERQNTGFLTNPRSDEIEGDENPDDVDKFRKP